MPKAAPIQNAINSGEFSPKLYGRTDINRYFSAAKKLENFIITPYGQIEKCPGTVFVAETKYSSKQSRLLEFEFSAEDNIIIEMGDQYLRFFKNNIPVGVPYEIATPFLESEIFDVHYVQIEDLVYLTHPNHPVQLLSRFSDTNWTISDLEYISPPFFPTNSEEAITMQPSATTGAITLTGVGSPFDANMVGGAIRLLDGYVNITGFTSANLVNGTVVGTLSATTATDDWSLGLSDFTGYPRALSFYQQRLFTGGAFYSPQTIWASKPLIYNDFEIGANDDDGLSFTISAERRNGILWLKSTRALNIGTSGATWILSSSSSTAAVTPSTINITLEDSYGSSSIQPRQVGPFVLFVTRNAKKVREFKFNFDTDSFIAGDTSIFSEHIPRKGIVDISYQQEPYNLLWCVLENGEIGLLTRQIEQEVIGWSRILTSGSFESVGIVGSSQEDEVWAIVNRTIDGNTKRYVEYFKPLNFEDKEDMFFVHSGFVYSGVSTNTVTGLDHLEGEEVFAILYNDDRDKFSIEAEIVEAGEITLINESSLINIGLAYDARLVQLNLEAGSANGTSQSKRKRVNEVFLRVEKTIGGQLGQEGETLDDIPFIDGSTLTYEFFTGDKNVPFPGGWEDNYNIEIKQVLPLPMNISAIMPRVRTND